ncbi:1-deoxy-D-xylulose-5-phosphate synthase family protein [Mycobacterium xenopi 3993]|nr:1-deoxy-D-xylulose-5-phosphate synthase family protein [Mycobacterium xenopi 3993]
MPLAGLPLYEALRRLKRGIKDLVAPQPLFEDLGLKYLGPIDGHNIASLEKALCRARDFGAPVVVHCITRKGFGYPPALRDPVDCLHGVGAFDVATGPSDRPPQLGRRGRRAAGGASAPRPGSSRGHCGNDTLGQPGRDGRRIPRPGLRRRHRRTARRDPCSRPGDGWAQARGLSLRHLPQPRLRPVAHGRRPASPAGHIRAQPGRNHRAGRAVAPWHVGPVLPAAGSRLGVGSPPRRQQRGRAATRMREAQRRPQCDPLPEGAGRPGHQSAGNR